jgi:hypothetical protein
MAPKQGRVNSDFLCSFMTGSARCGGTKTKGSSFCWRHLQKSDGSDHAPQETVKEIRKEENPRKEEEDQEGRDGKAAEPRKAEEAGPSGTKRPRTEAPDVAMPSASSAPDFDACHVWFDLISG